MILTRKQDEGLKIIIDRYITNEQYTVVAGYAGTGKSTLVHFAIDALNISPNEVAYATFTGKAAEVLRRKGNQGACTLHKLLYDHIPMRNGGFFRKAKPDLGVKVVVVDEVSMVPKKMVDMLLRHRVYVIFLGDPFQLPQIDKEQENHLLDNPHVFLDEIMRQAQESEIIQLTMKIRAGEEIKNFNGNEVKIFNKEELNTGMLTWADQILVATNATRQGINKQMRDILGYEGIPKDGERMICLRNYWDLCNESGDALVNGTTGIIHNPFECFRAIPKFVKNNRRELPTIVGDFLPDGSDAFSSIEMDKDMIINNHKCVDWRVAYQLGKLIPKIGDVVPKEFAFAYAITCHKAQGSEWDKVLVIEEKFPFEAIEHARWLYTACTRASEKLVLIRS